MGLLMNRHVRVQQLKQLEGAIEACDKAIDHMIESIEKTKERKEKLMAQLKIQSEAVAKAEKAQETLEKVAAEKKAKQEAKAKDTPKVTVHPDSKGKAMPATPADPGDQGEPATPAEPSEKASMEMKKDELMAMADEMGLEYDKSMKKEELVELINKG